MQAGGDAVFGIGTSRTQTVGRRAGARTHSGCGGQNRGLNLGRAEGLQVQIACRLHRAVHQLGAGRGHLGTVADQTPLALVRVVLVDQVNTVRVAELVTHVFVDVVAHQRRIQQHALACHQFGEFVALVVGCGFVVVRHGHGRLPDQVACDRQAHRCGLGRTRRAKRNRGGHRAQVGVNECIVECLHRHMTGGLVAVFVNLRLRIEGGPLGKSLCVAADTVECQGAGT